MTTVKPTVASAWTGSERGGRASCYGGGRGRR
uniref:Uncharacterized protein n=1 Tax=Arundo donax TaxID=35708 RepID=A0A0A9A8Z3_ARUDO